MLKETYSLPQYLQGLAPAPLWIPKSLHARVPYTKRHSLCIQPMRIIPCTSNHL